MRDFDTKALILFPEKACYDEASLRWRFQMQTAATNLCAYLRSIGMEPHAFITDDLARELPNTDFRWVATLNRGDIFFIQQNCGVPKTITQSRLVEFPEIVNGIAEKDTMPTTLSVDERFDHVLFRDKKAITSIIPTYKVVVNFQKKGSSRYRVVVKPNGGKIRIIVDTSSFMVKTYINNNEENPIDLLGVGFGNRSLVNWEV